LAKQSNRVRHASRPVSAVQNLQSWLAPVQDRFARLEKLLLWGAVLAIFLNSICNVIGRYLFGRSIYFSEELNQFLIILVTFIGASYATRQGRHIRMTAFYDVLPASLRKRLLVFILGTMAGLMLFFAYLSAAYVMDVAVTGRVSPALRIPYFVTYLVIPLGFFIAAAEYFLGALANLADDGLFISSCVRDEHEVQETCPAPHRTPGVE